MCRVSNHCISEVLSCEYSAPLSPFYFTNLATTQQPSHGHSMRALFEGTKHSITLFLNKFLVQEVVLMQKKKCKLLVYAEPPTPVTAANRNGSTSVTMDIKGKQTFYGRMANTTSPLSAGGKLSSQWSSTKMSAPCLAAGGTKGSHQRTGMQVSKSWDVSLIPRCLSLIQRRIPMLLVTVHCMRCDLLFLWYTAILFHTRQKF